MMIAALALLAAPAQAQQQAPEGTKKQRPAAAAQPAGDPTPYPAPGQPQPEPEASAAASTGGAAYSEGPARLPRMLVAGRKAFLMDSGLAAAPADAPLAVQMMIWKANEIQQHPYRYGGGHARVEDTGYDCSGTVSYALIGGGALKTPLDSSSFMSWGKAGKGKWVTIYTNPGHAYVVIAGLRLDTSSAGAGGGKGPRWRATGRPTSGFKLRHPARF